MHTDQARRLVTLHDQADRALANLRNAAAMATDDPRSTELLEEGGDAYASATAALVTEQSRVVGPLLKAEVWPSDPTQPSDTAVTALEADRAVWINRDGHGQGTVVAGVSGVAEGSVAVKLATDAHFRGEDYPNGSTVAIPADCLSLEDPAAAVSGAQGSGDDSGKGKVPAGA